MRILHTESSCGWGGQELRILAESQGLIGRGHSVVVAAPAQSRVLSEARQRGIGTVALPIARKNLAGLASLYCWLKANPVEVVNTHSSTDSWLTALACTMLKNPPPIVRTRHISAPVPGNLATRWLYGSASTHVVTTGEYLRRQLIEGNGMMPDRVTSVPTGIDVQHFIPGDRHAARKALGLPRDSCLIGVVATLRSWKGHRFLLEAFAEIPGKDCLLVVVGDGPQRASLEWLAARLRIEERVRFCGDQTDVLPWLQALDMFALPSYANEGLPQALVQAMLCALPCITTGVGSIGEAAVPEETALVVPPQNAAALRSALQRLIGEPALRRELGAAARKWCAARFGFESMLDSMERIFRGVAGRSRPDMRKAA